MRTLVLGVLLAGQTAFAQDSAKQPTAFCFSAKRADRCRSFLVTEVAILQSAMTTRGMGGVEDFGGAITATGGLLLNRGADRAWGVTAQISTDDPDEIGLSALEVRWRRWLQGGQGAVDLSAGYAEGQVYPVNSFGSNRAAHGVTAAISWVPVEWLGFTGRTIQLLDQDGNRRGGVRAGIQFGSGAAPIAAVSIVGGFALLFALAMGGG
jgi:hypothetical protein